MARPSLKEQRSEEILEAFVQCVAKFGLEGSTLERIAEQADMQRSILRHYVGNREDLIEALTSHIVAFFRERSDALFRATHNVEELVTALFGLRDSTDAEMVLVAEQLIAAADRYPRVRKHMVDWVRAFVGQVSDVIAHDFPRATEAQKLPVAYGLVGIYFNVESLSPLALPTKYATAAEDAARRLVSTLEK